MGPLSARLTLLGLCLSASARADDHGLLLLAVPVAGDPRPADFFEVELVATRAGAPVRSEEPPRVQVEGGALVGPLLPSGAGRWRGWVRLDGSVEPGGAVAMTLELSGQAARLRLPTRGADASGLKVPGSITGLAGRAGTVRIPVAGDAGLRPQDLTVYLSEGVVGATTESAEGLVLEWQTLDDPLPRALPFLVFDNRRPGSLPAMGVLRLVGRPRIPIETDPGANVFVEVGGRSYGPFLADAAGVAVAMVDVEPGESSAEVVAKDQAGNQQRTRIALGAPAPPRMVLGDEGPLVAGQPLPDLYLAAVRGDGQPWRGEAPACQTVVGGELVVSSLGDGLWHAELPPGTEGLFDLRVECSLAGQARAVDQVPVDPAVPSALRVRVFPAVLDADMPLAQVQAWLEGPLGDRLAAKGIELSALRGTIRPELGSAALSVAAYDGSEAIEAGEDEVLARWEPSVGEGGPWGLRVEPVGPRLGDGSLPVVVWAYDRRARPLATEVIAVQVGGARVELRSDAQGRAQLDLPVDPSDRGPWVIEAQARSARGSRLLFAQDFDDAQELDGLGLRARARVELRSGDVRRVVVSSRPERVLAGGVERARIVVSLQDQAGRAVAAELPRMRASQGQLGEVRLNEEGSFEAELTPPARLAYGPIDVEVEAAEGGWSASTRVEVLPRPLRLALGPIGGIVFGTRQGVAGFGGVELEFAPGFAPRGTLVRMAVGGWSRATELEDPRTAERVRVQTSWLPLGLGLLFRQERGRLGWFGGLQGHLVPYAQRTVFGDRSESPAFGFAGPGVEPLVGLGGRLANTELQVQLGYLWLTMPSADVSYDGTVGGLRPSLGWKFVF